MGIKDPARQAAYMREWNEKNYRKRRDALIEFLGGQCHACEATAGLHLQRNIVDELGETIVDIGNIWRYSLQNWQAAKPYLRLACTSHRENYRKGSMKHGAYWAAYRKKCKCGECLAYRVRLSQKRREQRAADRKAGTKAKPQAPRPKPIKAAPKQPAQTLRQFLDLASEKKVPAPAPPVNTRAPHGSFHVAINLGCRCEKCAAFAKDVE